MQRTQSDSLSQAQATVQFRDATTEASPREQRVSPRLHADQKQDSADASPRVSGVGRLESNIPKSSLAVKGSMSNGLRASSLAAGSISAGLGSQPQLRKAGLTLPQLSERDVAKAISLASTYDAQNAVKIPHPARDGPLSAREYSQTQPKLGVPPSGSQSARGPDPASQASLLSSVGTSLLATKSGRRAGTQPISLDLQARGAGAVRELVPLAPLPSHASSIAAATSAAAAGDPELSAAIAAATRISLLSPPSRKIPTVMFLLGGPGAGVNTQMRMLSSHYDITPIDIRSLLEAESATGSAAGQMIATSLESADHSLVPPAITLSLIQRVMEYHIRQGRRNFVIGNYPTSLKDWSAWVTGMTGYCEVSAAVWIDVPVSIQKQRLEARLLSKRLEEAAARGGNLSTDPTSSSEPLDPAKLDPADAHALAREISLLVNYMFTVRDVFLAAGRLKIVAGVALPTAVFQEVCQHAMAVQHIQPLPTAKTFKPTNIDIPGGVWGTAKPIVVIIMGGPGSGKKSIIKLIAKYYRFAEINVNEIVRTSGLNMLSETTSLVDYLLNHGKSVPPEAVTRMIKMTIEQQMREGRRFFLMHTFPVNMAQWQAFSLLESLIDIPLIIFLDCPEELRRARALRNFEQQLDQPRLIEEDPSTTARNLAKRRKNFEKSLETQLQSFMLETMPLIRQLSYSGTMCTIDAGHELPLVWRAVDSILLSKLPGVRRFSFAPKAALAPSNLQFHPPQVDESASGSSVKILSSLVDANENTLNFAHRGVAVFISGGPGAGCREISARIAEEYSFQVITAHDLYLQAAMHGTSTQREALTACILEGSLPPPHIAAQLIRRELIRHMGLGHRFFLIVGYPQRQIDFDYWQTEMSTFIDVSHCIYLSAPEAVRRARVLGRLKAGVENKFGELLQPPSESQELESGQTASRNGRFYEHAEATFSNILADVDAETVLQNRMHAFKTQTVPTLAKLFMEERGVLTAEQFKGCHAAVLPTNNPGLHTGFGVIEVRTHGFSVDESYAAVKASLAHLYPLAVSYRLRQDALTKPEKPVLVILTGPPGAGRGSASSHILQQYDFCLLNVRDILDAAARTQTADGHLVHYLQSTGQEIPSETVVQQLVKAIEDAHSRQGKYFFLLSGFPRSVDDWKYWQATIGDRIDLGCIIILDCPPAECEKRLMSRWAAENPSATQEATDAFIKDLAITRRKLMNSLNAMVEAVQAGSSAQSPSSSRPIRYIDASKPLSLVCNAIDEALSDFDWLRKSAIASRALASKHTLQNPTILARIAQRQRLLHSLGLSNALTASQTSPEYTRSDSISDPGLESPLTASVANLYLIVGGPFSGASDVARSLEQRYRFTWLSMDAVLQHYLTKTAERLLEAKETDSASSSPQKAKNRDRSQKKTEFGFAIRELRPIPDAYRAPHDQGSVVSGRLDVRQQYYDSIVFALKQGRLPDPSILFALLRARIAFLNLGLGKTHFLITGLPLPMDSGDTEFGRLSTDAFPTPSSDTLLTTSTWTAFAREFFSSSGSSTRQALTFTLRHVVHLDVSPRVLQQRIFTEEALASPEPAQTLDGMEVDETLIARLSTAFSTTQSNETAVEVSESGVIEVPRAPYLTRIAQRIAHYQQHIAPQLRTLPMSLRDALNANLGGSPISNITHLTGTEPSSTNVGATPADFTYSLVSITDPDPIVQLYSVLDQMSDTCANVMVRENAPPLPERPAGLVLSKKSEEGASSRARSRGLAPDGYPGLSGRSAPRVSSLHLLGTQEALTSLSNLSTLTLSVPPMSVPTPRTPRTPVPQSSPRAASPEESDLPTSDQQLQLAPATASSMALIVAPAPTRQPAMIVEMSQKLPLPALHVLVLVGGPGSGRSTLAKQLANEYGFLHVDTDQLLRDYAQAGHTPQARMIAQHLRAGLIVPSELSVHVVLATLQAARRSRHLNILLQGFPEDQAAMQKWQKLLGSFCHLVGFLYLECPPSVRAERARLQWTTRVSEQSFFAASVRDIPREPSNPNSLYPTTLSALKDRLQAFDRQTLPFLAKLASEYTFLKINADASPSRVFTEACKALGRIGYRPTLSATLIKHGLTAPDMATPMPHAVIFVTGPPGVGKTTMSADLATLYNIVHVNVCAVIGNEMRRRSPYGQTLSQCLSAHMGQPITPDLLLKAPALLVADVIRSHICETAVQITVEHAKYSEALRSVQEDSIRRAQLAASAMSNLLSPTDSRSVSPSPTMSDRTLSGGRNALTTQRNYVPSTSKAALAALTPPRSLVFLVDSYPLDAAGLVAVQLLFGHSGTHPCVFHIAASREKCIEHLRTEGLTESEADARFSTYDKLTAPALSHFLLSALASGPEQGRESASTQVPGQLTQATLLDSDDQAAAFALRVRPAFDQLVMHLPVLNGLAISRLLASYPRNSSSIKALRNTIGTSGQLVPSTHEEAPQTPIPLTNYQLGSRPASPDQGRKGTNYSIGLGRALLEADETDYMASQDSAAEHDSQFVKDAEEFALAVVANHNQALKREIALLQYQLSTFEANPSAPTVFSKSPQQTLSTRLQPSTVRILPIFVLGPPYSGKSEVCFLVAAHTHAVHLDVAALLELEKCDVSSPRGALLRDFAKANALPPSTLVTAVLISHIQRYASHGQLVFLIEGYPRSREDWLEWNRITNLPNDFQAMDSSAPFSQNQRSASSGQSHGSVRNESGTKPHIRVNNPPSSPGGVFAVFDVDFKTANERRAQSLGTGDADIGRNLLIEVQKSGGSHHLSQQSRQFEQDYTTYEQLTSKMLQAMAVGAVTTAANCILSPSDGEFPNCAVQHINAHGTIDATHAAFTAFVAKVLCSTVLPNIPARRAPRGRAGHNALSLALTSYSAHHLSTLGAPVSPQPPPLVTSQGASQSSASSPNSGNIDSQSTFLPLMLPVPPNLNNQFAPVPKYAKLGTSWILPFFIMGGPGSGRTTVANRLASELGIMHVSMTAIFEQEVRQRVATTWQRIYDCARQGSIVPGDIATQVLSRTLTNIVETTGCHVFVITGFFQDQDAWTCWTNLVGSSARDVYAIYLDCAKEHRLRRLIRQEEQYDSALKAALASSPPQPLTPSQSSTLACRLGFGREAGVALSRGASLALEKSLHNYEHITYPVEQNILSQLSTNNVAVIGSLEPVEVVLSKISKLVTLVLSTLQVALKPSTLLAHTVHAQRTNLAAAASLLHSGAVYTPQLSPLGPHRPLMITPHGVTLSGRPDLVQHLKHMLHTTAFTRVPTTHSSSIAGYLEDGQNMSSNLFQNMSGSELTRNGGGLGLKGGLGIGRNGSADQNAAWSMIPMSRTTPWIRALTKQSSLIPVSTNLGLSDSTEPTTHVIRRRFTLRKLQFVHVLGAPGSGTRELCNVIARHYHAVILDPDSLASIFALPNAAALAKSNSSSDEFVGGVTDTDGNEAAALRRTREGIARDGLAGTMLQAASIIQHQQLIEGSPYASTFVLIPNFPQSRSQWSTWTSICRSVGFITGVVYVDASPATCRDRLMAEGYSMARISSVFHTYNTSLLPLLMDFKSVIGEPGGAVPASQTHSSSQESDGMEGVGGSYANVLTGQVKSVRPATFTLDNNASPLSALISAATAVTLPAEAPDAFLYPVLGDRGPESAFAALAPLLRAFKQYLQTKPILHYTPNTVGNELTETGVIRSGSHQGALPSTAAILCVHVLGGPGAGKRELVTRLVHAENEARMRALAQAHVAASAASAAVRESAAATAPIAGRRGLAMNTRNPLGAAFAAFSATNSAATNAAAAVAASSAASSSIIVPASGMTNPQGGFVPPRFVAVFTDALIALEATKEDEIATVIKAALDSNTTVAPGIVANIVKRFILEQALAYYVRDRHPDASLRTRSETAASRPSSRVGAFSASYPEPLPPVSAAAATAAATALPLRQGGPTTVFLIVGYPSEALPAWSHAMRGIRGWDGDELATVKAVHISVPERTRIARLIARGDSERSVLSRMTAYSATGEQFLYKLQHEGLVAHVNVDKLIESDILRRHGKNPGGRDQHKLILQTNGAPADLAPADIAPYFSAAVLSALVASVSSYLVRNVHFAASLAASHNSRSLSALRETSSRGSSRDSARAAVTQLVPSNRDSDEVSADSGMNALFLLTHDQSIADAQAAHLCCLFNACYLSLPTLAGLARGSLPALSHSLPSDYARAYLSLSSLEASSLLYQAMDMHHRATGVRHFIVHGFPRTEVDWHVWSRDSGRNVDCIAVNLVSPSLPVLLASSSNTSDLNDIHPGVEDGLANSTEATQLDGRSLILQKGELEDFIANELGVSYSSVSAINSFPRLFTPISDAIPEGFGSTALLQQFSTCKQTAMDSTRWSKSRVTVTDDLLSSTYLMTRWSVALRQPPPSVASETIRALSSSFGGIGGVSSRQSGPNESNNKHPTQTHGMAIDAPVSVSILLLFGPPQTHTRELATHLCAHRGYVYLDPRLARIHIRAQIIVGYALGLRNIYLSTSRISTAEKQTRPKSMLSRSQSSSVPPVTKAEPSSNLVLPLTSLLSPSHSAAAALAALSPFVVLASSSGQAPISSSTAFSGLTTEELAKSAATAGRTIRLPNNGVSLAALPYDATPPHIVWAAAVEAVLLASGLRGIPELAALGLDPELMIRPLVLAIAKLHRHHYRHVTQQVPPQGDERKPIASSISSQSVNAPAPGQSFTQQSAIDAAIVEALVGRLGTEGITNTSTPVLDSGADQTASSLALSGSRRVVGQPSQNAGDHGALVGGGASGSVTGMASGPIEVVPITAQNLQELCAFEAAALAAWIIQSVQTAAAQRSSTFAQVLAKGSPEANHAGSQSSKFSTPQTHVLIGGQFPATPLEYFALQKVLAHGAITAVLDAVGSSPSNLGKDSVWKQSAESPLASQLCMRIRPVLLGIRLRIPEQLRMMMARHDEVLESALAHMSYLQDDEDNVYGVPLFGNQHAPLEPSKTTTSFNVRSIGADEVADAAVVCAALAGWLPAATPSVSSLAQLDPTPVTNKRYLNDLAPTQSNASVRSQSHMITLLQEYIWRRSGRRAAQFAAASIADTSPSCLLELRLDELMGMTRKPAKNEDIRMHNRKILSPIAITSRVDAWLAGLSRGAENGTLAPYNPFRALKDMGFAIQAVQSTPALTHDPQADGTLRGSESVVNAAAASALKEARDAFIALNIQNQTLLLKPAFFPQGLGMAFAQYLAGLHNEMTNASTMQLAATSRIADHSNNLPFISMADLGTTSQGGSGSGSFSFGSRSSQRLRALYEIGSKCFTSMSFAPESVIGSSLVPATVSHPLSSSVSATYSPNVHEQGRDMEHDTARARNMSVLAYSFVPITDSVDLFDKFGTMIAQPLQLPFVTVASSPLPPAVLSPTSLAMSEKDAYLTKLRMYKPVDLHLSQAWQLPAWRPKFFPVSRIVFINGPPGSGIQAICNQLCSKYDVKWLDMDTMLQQLLEDRPYSELAIAVRRTFAINGLLGNISAAVAAANPACVSALFTDSGTLEVAAAEAHSGLGEIGPSSLAEARTFASLGSGSELPLKNSQSSGEFTESPSVSTRNVSNALTVPQNGPAKQKGQTTRRLIRGTRLPAGLYLRLLSETIQHEIQGRAQSEEAYILSEKTNPLGQLSPLIDDHTPESGDAKSSAGTVATATGKALTDIASAIFSSSGASFVISGFPDSFEAWDAWVASPLAAAAEHVANILIDVDPVTASISSSPGLLAAAQADATRSAKESYERAATEARGEARAAQSRLAASKSLAIAAERTLVLAVIRHRASSLRSRAEQIRSAGYAALERARREAAEADEIEARNRSLAKELLDARGFVQNCEFGLSCVHIHQVPHQKVEVGGKIALRVYRALPSPHDEDNTSDRDLAGGNFVLGALVHEAFAFATAVHPDFLPSLALQLPLPMSQPLSESTPASEAAAKLLANEYEKSYIITFTLSNARTPFATAFVTTADLVAGARSGSLSVVLQARNAAVLGDTNFPQTPEALQQTKSLKAHASSAATVFHRSNVVGRAQLVFETRSVTPQAILPPLVETAGARILAAAQTRVLTEFSRAENLIKQAEELESEAESICKGNFSPNDSPADSKFRPTAEERVMSAAIQVAEESLMAARRKVETDTMYAKAAEATVKEIDATPPPTKGPLCREQVLQLSPAQRAALIDYETYAQPLYTALVSAGAMTAVPGEGPRSDVFARVVNCIRDMIPDFASLSHKPDAQDMRGMQQLPEQLPPDPGAGSTPQAKGQTGAPYEGRPPAKVVFILGPTGAGKRTLVNSVIDLIRNTPALSSGGKGSRVVHLDCDQLIQESKDQVRSSSASLMLGGQESQESPDQASDNASAAGSDVSSSLTEDASSIVRLLLRHIAGNQGLGADCFLVTGFPTTFSMWLKLLQEPCVSSVSANPNALKIEVSKVLALECPRQVCLQRLLKQRIQAKTAQKMLRDYDSGQKYVVERLIQEEPLLTVTIQANAPPSQVLEQASQIILSAFNLQ